MKGRKPSRGANVVPLTGELAGRDFDAMARARARELKPRGLTPEAGKIWDRLAPSLTHPQVARLKETHIEAFRQLCEAIARRERLQAFLRKEGETYEVETRNGLQKKNRPEVSQLNETFRQVVTLLRDFGMTPAAERSVLNGDQLPLPLDGDDFA